MQDQSLSKLQQFIDDSNQTNSSTDKINVLKKWSEDEDVKKGLHYTYNFFKKYNVTSANCKKRADLIAPVECCYPNIFQLLDDLSDRKITGHEAIQAVNRFVAENSEYEDLIWCIIDRNLKTRSTITLINKVIPDLIPVFDVALALPYDDRTKKKVKWKDGWYCSRKLDGVRCLTIIDSNGEPTFYSRKGNEFTTLGKLVEEIKKLGLKNMVLDGEMCVVDEDGNENFTAIVSEIKRKDYTVENPQYLVFDLLTLEEFNSKVSTRGLSQRYTSIKDLLDNAETTRIKRVKQILIADEEELKTLITMAKEREWEGLMLRKDSTYKGKRSDEILKVKAFLDAEYVVKGTENSISRVIIDGEEVEEETLKCIIIEHKGCDVQVGSGFSLADRRRYFAHPEEIIGKTVTVQYFEESQNQSGGFSLRFPVIKMVYDEERDV
jgi:DNA ligase-1